MGKGGIDDIANELSGKRAPEYPTRMPLLKWPSNMLPSNAQWQSRILYNDLSYRLLSIPFSSALSIITEPYRDSLLASHLSVSVVTNLKY
jgi:hypothetical protein